VCLENYTGDKMGGGGTGKQKSQVVKELEGGTEEVYILSRLTGLEEGPTRRPQTISKLINLSWGTLAET